MKTPASKPRLKVKKKNIRRMENDPRLSACMGGKSRVGAGGWGGDQQEERGGGEESAVMAKYFSPQQIRGRKKDSGTLT